MDDCKQQIKDLFKALKFAAEKHRNQRRKDRDASPYINHPIDICHTLCGEKILNLVLKVTDDKTLSKEVRKDLQVKTARYKSKGAKQIRIADKISNVTDIINFPPAGWSRERKLEYLEWTEKVIDEFKGTNECLESLYRERLAEAKRKVAASG